MIGYHFPCLDGIYSMMNTFLACKLYSEFNPDLMDRLFHEDIQKTYAAALTQAKAAASSKKSNSAPTLESQQSHPINPADHEF